MKRLFLLLAILISSALLCAQDTTRISFDRPLNNVNINVCGDISVISLNYERLQPIASKFFLSFKLGMGYNTEYEIWNTGDPDKSTITSFHISGNYGKKNNLELGLGTSLIKGNPIQEYLIYSILGYRYQPISSNKFNLRLFTLIPLTKINKGDTFLFIPFGVSVGYCF